MLLRFAGLCCRIGSRGGGQHGGLGGFDGGLGYRLGGQGDGTRGDAMK